MTRANPKLLPGWLRWLIYPAVIAIAFWRLEPIWFKSEYNGFELANLQVPVEEIEHGGPPRDGIPALADPEVVNAEDASFMRPEDRVIGVTVGSEARAYPIRILNYHEIVNDRLSGRRILVTYCPLCGSGAVFDPRVSGLSLEFGVSGLLYKSDLLMYDRQTESLWSQLGMQAISGELSGEKLTLLPAMHTTWRDWTSRHPESTVLSLKTGYWRDYSQNPYERYAAAPGVTLLGDAIDQRYPPKELVVGVIVDGVSKAYPYPELAKASKTSSAGPIEDSVAGQTLKVHFDPDSGSVNVRNASGEPVPTVISYYFAWMAFYPDSRLFLAPDEHSKRKTQ